MIQVATTCIKHKQMQVVRQWVSNVTMSPDLSNQHGEYIVIISDKPKKYNPSCNKQEELSIERKTIYNPNK